MDTLDSTIASLKRMIQKREVVFFVGAGISFNSGVPTVSQIYPEIARALDISLTEFKRVIDGYPFERVIQTLLRDEDIKKHFKKLFSQTRSSRIHYFLANQIDAGARNVLTTNFDQLIEIAYKEMHGVNLKKLLPKDFQCNVPVKRKLLIKLHGCISQSLSDLGVTINAVANKSNQSRIRSILERVISKKVLIVMLGYSGSDIFDIVPALNDLAGTGCTLCYVRHSESKSPLIKELNDPFKGFVGKEIECDTDYFVDLISEEETDGVFKDKFVDSAWLQAFTDWKQDISVYKGLKELETLSHFYKEKNEMDAAIDCDRRSLQILKDNNGFGYPNWIPLISNQLAQALRFRRNEKKSNDDLNEALALSRYSVEYYEGLPETKLLQNAIKKSRDRFVVKGELIRDYTNAMGSYALMLKSLGRFSEAIKEYGKILKICSWGGLGENICLTYANMGAVYIKTEPLKAVEFYGRSVELCNQFPVHYRLGLLGLADAYAILADKAFSNGNLVNGMNWIELEKESVTNALMWAKRMGQSFDNLEGRIEECERILKDCARVLREMKK